MENTYIQVVTTTNTLSEAEAIAMTVLESRLAVCMQITPCTSFYHWKGKIEKAEEFRCLMKTKRELFPQLSAKIQTMHSYETPEIIATVITHGDAAYLKWMADELHI